MHPVQLSAMCRELVAEVAGRQIGRIYQLSRFEIVFDVHLNDGRWLFISFEPARPRVFLTRRRLRDLEKQETAPSPFVVTLRREIPGVNIDSIEVMANERVLVFRLVRSADGDSDGSLSLIAQLTGRSSNLFLVDHSNKIVAAAGSTKGKGQTVGEIYSPPERKDDMSDRSKEAAEDPKNIRASMDKLSEKLDAEDREKREAKRFEDLAASVRSKLISEIKRNDKLISNLKSDLAKHGDPEKWKRFGDILLANIGSAEKNAEAFIVTDYFETDLPKIEIPHENDEDVQTTAARYFRRYTKARNAATEIAQRIEAAEKRRLDLNDRSNELEKLIADRDIESLNVLAESRGSVQENKKRTAGEKTSKGYRTFISSDGFEILVGKKARDNDNLTLRIAKSLEIWMHAADYPGSHVVIRGSGKREVPNGTLLEAAELAAFYSQGRKQVKAAVHYTQRKFVNKPKGAAPGLVSLASFKTILVEPKIPDGVQMQ